METQKSYRSVFKNISEMENAVGKELGLTPWKIMDQERINTFAKATEDEQWIHIDEERCTKESPYKQTIAHGFLMLSMCSKIMYDSYEVGKVSMAINYGLDKVRFLSPVPVNSEVRILTKCIDVTEKNPGQFLVKNEVKMEIKGVDKPAYIAETLSLFIT